MDLRRLRAGALGLPLLAALACERPTAPEFLERAERIGQARIDALPGAPGECEFLEAPLHMVGPQTRVECELVEYEVNAEVVLGVVGDPPTSVDASPTTQPEIIGERRVRLVVPLQRVPGARLRVYCNDVVEIGGCRPLDLPVNP